MTKGRKSRSTFRASLTLAVGYLATGLMMLVSTPAQADSISYDFITDHCTGGCGPSPFGSVTLTQDGGDVDVVVHLYDSNYFVKTGSADFQAFKFNGVDVALADITVDPHSPTLVAATGNFNGNGTGQFAFGINCPSCGGGASNKFNTDIVFHVASASIADLTALNNSGYAFAADILSGTTGNTGPVGASEGTPVPEPGTLLLLGSGLASIATWGRRRLRGRAQDNVNDVSPDRAGS